MSTEFSFADLRREPDIEGPDLLAADAADRLILDEAAQVLADLGDDAQVAILGDRYGALALGAIALHGVGHVRTWIDSRAGQLATQRNITRAGSAVGPDAVTLHSELDSSVLAGANVVLIRLPRALAELEELAQAIAAHADAGVQVFAGGRVKHMHRSMNGVLGTSFGTVEASLGRQNSRVLRARDPRAGTDWSPQFVTSEHADVGLAVRSRTGVFVGSRIDTGTAQLLAVLDAAAPHAGTALDLGCGSGVLATTLAKARPDCTVLASDDSAVAVASARATARANGVQVTVSHDDAVSELADASVDLVVLNPPFHRGAEVGTGLAHKLFEAAARVLRPGGELWVVWNSHLRYRSALQSIVGPTRQISRDPRFTVTSSVRR